MHTGQSRRCLRWKLEDVSLARLGQHGKSAGGLFKQGACWALSWPSLNPWIRKCSDESQRTLCGEGGAA